LIDQGYQFKIITELEGIKDHPDLVYKTFDEQISLLKSTLEANESEATVAKDLGEDDYSGFGKKKVGSGFAPRAKRVQGNIEALSG
jgi:DNA excision repair protein ERCC-3